jgi:glycosyltransferase involved in cell wall biosynthesis
MSKRVLHFQGRMGRGGAESFMMNLYREIDREKFQFDFLIYDDFKDVRDYHDEIEKLGGRIFVVTNPKKNIFKYILEVNKLLKKENFDIAHNEVYFGGGINLKLAKKNGIKKRIAHSHATSDGKSQNIIMNILRKYLDRLLKENATDFLAVSKEAGESLFHDTPYEIIHNGIKLEDYQLSQAENLKTRQNLGLSEQDFIIGNIGRLEPQKNQQLLIEIFSKLLLRKRNAKLLLIGEGSLRTDLQEKINELNLEDSVQMLGERADIPALLNVMDVFVMTSLYEGLPMVGLEAQASGKKLVLSNEISHDTKVTPNVQFVELSAPDDEWINAILNEPFGNQRTSELESYDVSFTTKQMERIYSNIE